MIRFRRLCFTTCLWGLTLSVLAGAATVSGVISRQTDAKAKSRIERYPARSGNSTARPGEADVSAVVYLVSPKASGYTPPEEYPQMIQRDQDFHPSVMAILVGTTVDFPNLDPVYHNVFSYSKAKKFDLGRYPKGKSKSVTFDNPGLIKVFCEIHPSMRAHILVLEQPHFAVTNPDGSYRIANVPPGVYTLRVWQENAPEFEQEVTVAADDSLVVDVR